MYGCENELVTKIFQFLISEIRGKVTFGSDYMNRKYEIILIERVYENFSSMAVLFQII